MSLSPARLVRIGFGFLALAVCLGIWMSQVDALGVWAMLLAGVAFLAVLGLGEMVFRRVATAAEIRADLEDRVRNGN